MFGWTLGCRLGLLVGAVLAVTGTSALAQPFELSVKKDQFFGASEGTLVFGAEGVAYDTVDADDARQWAYDDLKQVQILSPTRITIKTYEDQGWIKFGADRTFEFEITEGDVPSDLVVFLWNRADGSLVTAILPPAEASPLLAVPVKLRQRLRGSHGVLQLHEDRLSYVTDRTGHTRAWRSGDLRMVYQPDRHRLNIDAYEGGGDHTRTFSFDLKEPLPAGFLDMVWEWVHTPSMSRRPDRGGSQ